MGDGSWTVYVGGIYEESSDQTYVKYYSAFGRRIAMRDNAGVVHYILADHLGSSTVITDGGGAVVGTMKYYPYGAVRSVSGDMITDKLFTGQQREEPTTISTLGLYNYGARFYSTLTGRFVSADPVVQDINDPQALNAYSYVRNNPLVYVDPTGMYLDEIVPQSPFPSLSATAATGLDIAELAALVLNYVDCALNGNCASVGMTQENAQTLVASRTFWTASYVTGNNLADHDLFWAIIGVLLEGDGMTDARMALIPEAGWQVMAKEWGVPAGFLRASLFDIANGTTVKTSELGAKDIVGAFPWWCKNALGQSDVITATRARLTGEDHGFVWMKRAAPVETVLAYMTIVLWGLLGPSPPTPQPWSEWQTAEVLGGIDRGAANIPPSDLPYRPGGPDRQP
jgi:RHS repeat-associated protein